MTAVSTEIETVVDDLTAHEFDIPCDSLFYVDGPCPSPARWSGLKSCCADVSLLCTTCKDRTMLSDGGVECKGCHGVVAPARHMYTHFEPIGRA